MKLLKRPFRVADVLMAISVFLLLRDAWQTHKRLQVSRKARAAQQTAFEKEVFI